MSKARRGLILLATIVLPMWMIGPAQGATYAPGTAVAYKVVYNQNTGYWDYHCAFNNWRSGGKVVWHCELHDIHSALPWGGGLIDTIIQDHTGSWTPPPSYKTTATYHLIETTGAHGQLCVVARALSVDGGVSKRYCN